MLVGPFFGTVKCKTFIPFWGFVTGTPTRALAQTCWGLTASSVPQLCLAMIYGHCILYQRRDWVYLIFWGEFLSVFCRGRRFLTLALQENYTPPLPHTQKNWYVLYWGKARFFLNKTEILSLLHWQFFFVCRKTGSVSVSNQFLFVICGCWRDFLPNQKKICGWEIFKRLPTKGYEN